MSALDPMEEERRRELAIDFTDPPEWPEWASNDEGIVWTRLDLSDRWESLDIVEVEDASWGDEVGTLIAPRVVPMLFRPSEYEDEWRIEQAHPEQEFGVRLYTRWEVTTTSNPVSEEGR